MISHFPVRVYRLCPTPSSCIPPMFWEADETPSTPPRLSLSLETPATEASVWAEPTVTRAASTQVNHFALRQLKQGVDFFNVGTYPESMYNS